MTFRVQIYTQDYESVCSFYQNILKLPVLIKRETDKDDRVIVYKAASGEIEVIYSPDNMEAPKSCGWTVQIQVDNIDSFYELILKSDYRVLREPQDQFWGHRNLKVLDPTGLELTFFSPKNN